MKFKKLWTNGFGCLGRWESPDLDSNLLVVYGSNESGKTTLFKLISTVLYGWSPVADNPWIPWDSGCAECEALIADSRNREYRVHRKLKSRPEGTVILEDKKYHLGNKPVDLVNYIPATIFNEVCALTLDQLCFPDAELYSRMQDQLLGGQYSGIFNPVTQTVTKLEEEAGSLWRPNRMGKPKFKQLTEITKKLRQDLAEAEENERAMGNIEKEIERIKTEMAKTEAEKAKALEYINRYERLYPVIKKLNRIHELQELSGNIRDYDYVPDDVESILQVLYEKKAGLKREYDEALMRRQNAMTEYALFSEKDKKVLEHRDEIENLIRSYGMIDSNIRMAGSLKEEVDRLQNRLYDRARELLQGGWNDGAAKSIMDIDEASLRASIMHFKSENQSYNQQEAAVSGLKAKSESWRMPGYMPYLSAALCALGGVGMLMLKNTPAGILSGIISLLGCCLLMICMLGKTSRLGAELKEAQKKLDRIGYSRKNAVEDVRHELKGLNVSPIRLENPDETLLLDVITIKELHTNIQSTMERLNKASLYLKNMDESVGEQMDYCSLSRCNGILDNVNMLKDRLNEALEHYRSFREARAALNDINRTLSGISDKMNGVEEQYGSIVKSLNSMEGDDLKEKIYNLKERRKLLRKAEEYKEELEHEYPDLDRVLEEIKAAEDKGEKWVFDDHDVALVRVRLEALDRSLNELNERMGFLKKDLEQRATHEKPCDIQSMILDAENEKRLVAAKRDRLMLLGSIITEADRVFREENQPDVLHKAGRYLNIITGGRYDKIYSEGYNSSSLSVRESASGRLLNVEQNHLSRGTSEQVYLSLRIATAEHLETEGETLPLFFDEVLVNWDGFRTDNMLKLLKSISMERQVFIFTCHRELADKLSSECGAVVVGLLHNEN